MEVECRELAILNNRFKVYSIPFLNTPKGGVQKMQTKLLAAVIGSSFLFP